MRALSLRTRVAAAVAITCIAVVSALALTLYTASEDLEESLIDQIVSEEMDFLIRQHRDFPAVPRQPGPNVQYYVAETQDELLKIPESLRTLAAGNHEVGQGIDEQHVVVRVINGTRYIVAYDVGPHEAQGEQFKQLVLFALATIMIFAAALGYWIAGLITRQITDLAGKVAMLDPGARRTPLSQEGQDPEVAALAHALDHYQTRITELLEREQEFTGNASHELRTPLTAIRTSCELLEQESGLPDKVRTRIAAIAAAAERMTEQIEVLLFLARAEAMDGVEEVALAECIETAIEPWRAEIARKQLNFDNTIARDAKLAVNRHALHLVLGNILGNAVRYTAQGSIRIRWRAPTLTIADTGPGVPPDQRARVFDRHYRGASHVNGLGLGLGLAIVKRACDQLHWKIDVTTPVDGGTEFLLTLA